MQESRKNAYGLLVRALREQRGLDQRQLADALGYESDGMISMIEQGQTMPSLDKALEMARFFQTTVEAMYGVPETGDSPALVPAPAADRHGRLLLLPHATGAMLLSGWTVEEVLQLMRMLHEMGLPFPGT